MRGPIQNPDHRFDREREVSDRGIKGIFGEVVPCCALYRLHTAVVEEPERRMTAE